MHWRCSRCGEEHEGLPDLAYEAPDPWIAATEADRARGSIDPDLCRLPYEGSDAYFVRAVLELPIRDADESFAFGVWCAVSEAGFERYVEIADDRAALDEPPLAARLANEIAAFPRSLNLRGRLRLLEPGLRPAFVVVDRHPLRAAQREGLPVEEVVAMVEPALHDGP